MKQIFFFLFFIVTLWGSAQSQIIDSVKVSVLSIKDTIVGNALKSIVDVNVSLNVNEKFFFISSWIEDTTRFIKIVDTQENVGLQESSLNVYFIDNVVFFIHNSVLCFFKKESETTYIKKRWNDIEYANLFMFDDKNQYWNFIYTLGKIKLLDVEYDYYPMLSPKDFTNIFELVIPISDNKQFEIIEIIDEF